MGRVDCGIASQTFRFVTGRSVIPNLQALEAKTFGNKIGIVFDDNLNSSDSRLVLLLTQGKPFATAELLPRNSYLIRSTR
jgi:hypothetical protein